MSEKWLAHYLSPIAKILLFALFLLICALPFGLIADFNFVPRIEDTLLSNVVMHSFLVIIVLGALLMTFKVLPPLDFHDVFVRKANAFDGFAKGSGVGFCIMLLVAGLIFMSGNVNFVKTVISWDQIGLYLIYFMLVALFEELMFRSYPLYALIASYPVWLVVLLNGLLFAMVHLGNSGLTAVGIINIALAGILLSLITLQKQNISWAIGIHFSWNFTQSIILGYKVSGNEVAGLVKALPKGESFLSGGAFGIEGSIWCTAVLLVYISWLIFKEKSLRKL